MKLEAIFIREDKGYNDDELFEDLSEDVLVAMSRHGVVDETTLELKKTNRDGYANLGTPTEPYMISFWQMNLVGVLFSAEAEPHSEVPHIDPESREYHTVSVKGEEN